MDFKCQSINRNLISIVSEVNQKNRRIRTINMAMSRPYALTYFRSFELEKEKRNRKFNIRRTLYRFIEVHNAKVNFHQKPLNL